MFTGSYLQQIGIAYTTAGKAGFLTALYVVLVPVLGIFLKKASEAYFVGQCGVGVRGAVFSVLYR